MLPCDCCVSTHETKLVVVTGGPGAGKTSFLELVKQSFCAHVQVLPEAAGIVFGGGFPRRADPIVRRAAQRAIYHVQRELERAALEEHRAAVALCDRGTVDGLAYWPGEPETYWRELGVAADDEITRYAAVIQLRTPPAHQGYDHSNPLRLETAEEAQVLDARIEAAWHRHPQRYIVDHADSFLVKVTAALEYVRRLVPPCCRKHELKKPHEAG